MIEQAHSLPYNGKITHATTLRDYDWIVDVAVDFAANVVADGVAQVAALNGPAQSQLQYGSERC